MGRSPGEQARQWYSRHEVRALVHHGEWSRLHKGVLCEANCRASVRTRLAAAGLAVGVPVTACLATAAELYSFGVVASNRLHVVDPGSHLRCRTGLTLHQLELAKDELTVVDGLSATSPARTAVELARTVSGSRALAVFDAALRSATVTAEELEVQCARQAGRRGIVQVRSLLPLADGRAESPMESATRLILRKAGLPAPELQYAVLDRFGRPCRYLDFAWPAQKVALEYDGVDAHTGAVALRRDRDRYNFLVEQGWTVIYATADDILRNPVRLVSRIRDALARARFSGDHGGLAELNRFNRAKAP